MHLFMLCDIVLYIPVKVPDYAYLTKQPDLRLIRPLPETHMTTSFT